MSTACLPLYLNSLTASSILTKNTNSKTSLFSITNPTLHGCSSSVPSLSCKASTSSSPITDFDLYDLLGLDRSSDQRQIKAAYRMLQKKCHPDIAGESGHEMAIILNEAYSLLSDPVSRSAYDKEQAKIAELKDYTGKPVYSVWSGPETEQRAVFVDEIKCIGCLKCALFASNTFAIESGHGRARVVAQWADPETKIQEAIETCPVDCISFVERSDLPALEFLMAKLPRGNVRVGASQTAGARVPDVFADVKRFKTRYAAMYESEGQDSQETNSQSDARTSAVQAIRSISNWLYWKLPNAERNSRLAITHVPRKKSSNPDIKKLREAAAARKEASKNTTINKTPLNHTHQDEYWVPSAQALPSAIKNTSSTFPSKSTKPLSNNTIHNIRETKSKRRRTGFGIPVSVSAIAAFIVQLQIREGSGELKEHLGGSLALSLVNSSWQQVILAAITWYVMGVIIAEFVEAIRNN